MSIVEASPAERVAIRIDFSRPLKSTSTTELRLTPEDGGVRVVWVMDGRLNFVGKAVSILASMDSMVGGDFERGLAGLKKVAEAEATGDPAQR